MNNPLQATAEEVRQTYPCLTKGEGAWVYDDAGNRYLYLSTAVPTVGLGNRRVIQAMTEQYETLSFASTCAQGHPFANQLSERLTRIAHHEHAMVFFSNDGSGAVETAMKLVRQYYRSKGEPQRTRFLSFEGSYHGTTFGSGSVTHMGIKESFGPGLEGCFSIPAPHLYRPPVAGDEAAFEQYCLEQLEKTILTLGADTIAAILIEPIQGVNGVVLFPQDFWQKVQCIARRYDLLLIADEVGTGLGRTGHWLASHHYGIKPDLVALSKGLTGGYFPMGATIISEEIIAELYKEGGIFLHGSTLCGHPVACVAALTILEMIEQDGLLEQARQRGEWILNRLKQSLLDHPQVGDIRGMGMMLAIELVSNRETKTSVSFAWSRAFTATLRQAGILANFFNGVLSMYPPLTLSDDEADYLVTRLIDVLAKMPKEEKHG